MVAEGLERIRRCDGTSPIKETAGTPRKRLSSDTDEGATDCSQLAAAVSKLLREQPRSQVL